MNYASAGALRAALEVRLNATAESRSVSIDRLRRRVVFERILVRLDVAEPDCWVLKGGMALDVRLGERARRSLDIDVGMREGAPNVDEVHDRIVEALAVDPDSDYFVFETTAPRELVADGQGVPTWRCSVRAMLDGREFGTVQLDVSPRPSELQSTERLPLPGALDFAGVPARTVEMIDANRHIAEKFHALTRTYGDRPNTRVRDLVDIVLMIENEVVTPATAAPEVVAVFVGRKTHDAPIELPDPPSVWESSWTNQTQGLVLESADYASAVAKAREFWAQMLSVNGGAW